MLEHAAQPVEMGLTAEAKASPFDDIAAVHAMYEQRVFRLLLFSLRDRDAALSLTQDTFLNAWRSRDSFRGECSIATWLMRIAVSLLRSHTRTETFRFWRKAAVTAVDVTDVETQLVASGSSAESAMAARQQLTQVWDAVGHLSARQRTVFLLRFVEEQELSEIAAATGMPVATVKSHLYRALDKVRSAAQHTPQHRERKGNAR